MTSANFVNDAMLHEEPHARDRFKIGDRVRYSEEGRKALRPRKRYEHAVVVGFNRNDPDQIHVRRAGHKTLDFYHHKFWEHAK